jgi:hypothetical protein
MAATGRGELGSLIWQRLQGAGLPVPVGGAGEAEVCGGRRGCRGDNYEYEYEMVEELRDLLGV